MQLVLREHKIIILVKKIVVLAQTIYCVVYIRHDTLPVFFISRIQPYTEQSRLQEQKHNVKNYEQETRAINILQKLDFTKQKNFT